jgi:hypothetical protein
MGVGGAVDVPAGDKGWLSLWDWLAPRAQLHAWDGNEDGAGNSVILY